MSALKTTAAILAALLTYGATHSADLAAVVLLGIYAASGERRQA